MQTNFSAEQLENTAIAEANEILRNCVHCGFCTATCPTYVTLGNELDSPRGRIYLIKNMLENDAPADEVITTHIDRCLSCLSCMSTCPSGVHYMHLVDHARVHIENTYKRPLLKRLYRNMLANILPYPNRVKAAFSLALLGKPFAPIFKRVAPLKPIGAMLELAPNRLSFSKKNQSLPVKMKGQKIGRVAILSGCAQPAIRPEINDATLNLLHNLGVEVASAKGEGCCGSLVHHMGREDEAHRAAKNNIDVWVKLMEKEPLDAIIITTSGCGTTIKDYGYMLKNDEEYAEKAALISSLAKDITEYLENLDLPEPLIKPGQIVAYHSACSLQHGQKVKQAPKKLLENAGFIVREPAEGHLCCGSAGTYNILQPEISQQLKERKVKNIEQVSPDMIATGNIGCMTQIATGTDVPIIHTVELLNWAYGGKKPAEISAGN